MIPHNYDKLRISLTCRLYLLCQAFASEEKCESVGLVTDRHSCREKVTIVWWWGGVLSQEFVCWILLTYSEMYVVVYRLRKHQYNGKSRREGCYAGERILWKNVSSGKILKWAIRWRKQIPEHHWSSLWSEVRQRECWTEASRCCLSRKMTVGRQDVVLGVWDTAGSERYESMTKMYYR